MDSLLLSNILRNMTFIAVIAYLISKTETFRKALVNTKNFKETLLLACIFGVLSILGNNLGIPMINGSLANNRIIGPVLGGLLGGPWVGIGAGLIGAVHRATLGGFTTNAAVISNIAAGYIGSIFYKKVGPQSLKLWHGFLACFLAELVLKGLVLTISKPFSAAIELEKAIALPTILINCLGTTIFLLMVKDIYQERENYSAQSAEKSLKIAIETLSTLRHGLDFETAQKTCSIIKTVTGLHAVAITDGEKILAFSGHGSDHHRPGSMIFTNTTKKVFATKEIVVSHAKDSLTCSHSNCPLTALIETPLLVNNEVVATIQVFKTNGYSFSPTEEKIIKGTAQLLSMQLELAAYEKKAKLLANAEYHALKAQINPHFLFNTLTTAMSLCRINPDLARQTLKELASFFRGTLEIKKDLISIAEELNTLHSYIAIEKLRFGNRLKVVEEIAPNVQQYLIPIFSIQPLVENALKHGLFPKTGPGTLIIKIEEKEGHIVITIKDDGVGIPPSVLNLINKEKVSSHFGVGLANVNKRIKAFYGENYGLEISSQLQKGTTVKLRVPCSQDLEEENANDYRPFSR